MHSFFYFSNSGRFDDDFNDQQTLVSGDGYRFRPRQPVHTTGDDCTGRAEQEMSQSVDAVQQPASDIATWQMALPSNWTETGLSDDSSVDESLITNDNNIDDSRFQQSETGKAICAFVSDFPVCLLSTHFIVILVIISVWQFNVRSLKPVCMNYKQSYTILYYTMSISIYIHI